MTTLSDRTKFTWAVVVVLLGFSAWITTIYNTVTSSALAIQSVQSKQEAKQTQDGEMVTKITVMSFQVDEINKKLDELKSEVKRIQ